MTMKILKLSALLAGSALCSIPALAATVETIPGGVAVTPDAGPSDRVEVTHQKKKTDFM